MNSFIPWIGGKKALRNTILEKFPIADTGRYIEVFGGAGWVFFARNKASNQMEVFNDADGQLINLYRCVKYHTEALLDELNWLLSSRELFLDAKEQLCMRGLTDIQRAARFLYLIKISFGASKSSFATAPKSMESMQEILLETKLRLHRVVIENLDFERLIQVYDRPDALFYCDPPYVGTEKYYKTAFNEADHDRLVHCLQNIKGKFVLSYNDHPSVRQKYRWAKSIESAQRNNTLCGTSEKRGIYKEVIIKNF